MSLRIEPCACGGEIMARPDRVIEAVQRHNMSLTHCVWRLGREMPTATVTLVTCPSPSPRASASPAKSWAHR